MFLLGYLARFVPVAALALAATIAIRARVARGGGRRQRRRMAPNDGTIVLPQIRLGLLAAWVIAFVLAFGELGVSILVAPPGEATLPIRDLHDHREHAALARRCAGPAAGRASFSPRWRCSAVRSCRCAERR